MSFSGLMPVFKNLPVYSRFTHPQSVCMSYFEHCRFSLNLARCFAFGSFKAIVHAFFPSLYITSSSDLLVTMKEDMVKIGCRRHDEEEEEEVIEEKEEVTEEVNSWTNRGIKMDDDIQE